LRVGTCFQSAGNREPEADVTGRWAMGLFGFGDPKGAGPVDTLLGPGALFRGNLHSKGTLHVEGEVTGNLSSDDGIIVGEKGVVRGGLTGRVLVISGKVKGNLSASARIELTRTGEVTGDLTTPELLVENGAVFIGSSHMEDAGKVVEISKAARE
jgi:cytoskeletal protein CcmA (bactofilin family)